MIEAILSLWLRSCKGKDFELLPWCHYGAVMAAGQVSVWLASPVPPSFVICNGSLLNGYSVFSFLFCCEFIASPSAYFLNGILCLRHLRVRWSAIGWKDGLKLCSGSVQDWIAQKNMTWNRSKQPKVRYEIQDRTAYSRLSSPSMKEGADRRDS